MASIIKADITDGIVLTSDTSGVLEIQAVNGMKLPSWTTANRPSSPVAGLIGFNTTTGYPEWYDDSTSNWIQYNQAIPYSISYLVVAGGGGGGTAQTGVNLGAGGGAGGFLTGTTNLFLGTKYTITVGAGGAASTQGSASSIGALVSTVGGGYGGNNVNITGGNGGSGGGTSGGSSSAGGSGTSGQGNNGGAGSAASNYGGGGGGGASAVGGNGSGTNGGNGGAGTASSITGSSVTYAGGGGGGIFSISTAGTGGAGGGGNGANNGGAGSAGTVNTGGGGGGSSQLGTTVAGGAGGSGIVVLSIPTANYSGTYTGSPTITTSGSNTILKFTASGSYTA